MLEGEKEPWPLPQAIQKSNLKCVTGLNAMIKIIKHLEKNVRANLHDLEVGKYFFNKTQRARAIIEKTWYKRHHQNLKFKLFERHH